MKTKDAVKLLCPIYPNGKKLMLCIAEKCACWTAIGPITGGCGMRRTSEEEYSYDTAPNTNK